MSPANHISTLNMNGETVIAKLTSQLTSSGLRIVRSFDLKSARASYKDLTCPYHGSSPCDCQMVVLLVYGDAAVPASVVLHCHRGITAIDIIENPNNHPDDKLVDLIQQAAGTILQSSFFRKKQVDVSNQ